MKRQKQSLVSYSYQLGLDEKCQLMELLGVGCHLLSSKHRPSGTVRGDTRHAEL